MNDVNHPSYLQLRSFLGRKDVCVSFRTKKCSYKCAFCGLARFSLEFPINHQLLRQQIDHVFERYHEKMDSIQQFSAGNDGSILNAKTFYPGSMDHLLAKLSELPRLEVLSLESRIEFATRRGLDRIRKLSKARILDITVGLETQDDELRNNVLNKRLERQTFEQQLRILAESGFRLTSYVMIKPGPYMTDEEGVAEAIATIRYLHKQCQELQLEFIAYLTPTYVAQGSVLEQVYRSVGYLAPRIQDVYRVACASLDLGHHAYTGLWCEDLAAEDLTFLGRDDYDPAVQEALLQYNKTGDSCHLKPFQYLLSPQ